jgi:uncharacterized protein YbbC (DUF1343 family)
MHGARNKKWIVRLSALWICATSAQASVEIGTDVLASHDPALLAGQRIGLVTNRSIASTARRRPAGP